MEHQDDTRKLVQTYAIYTDLDYDKVTEISTPTNKEVLYWVKHYRVPVIGLNGHRWNWYGYECFTPDGNLVTELQKNGWKTSAFKSTGDIDYINFVGHDPKGRRLDLLKGKRIEGVISVLKFLDEVSQYESWEQYKLQNENLELLAKLEQLKAEKARLARLLESTG